MDFSKQFDERWENVIRPAIESVDGSEGKLKAVRTDSRVINDSILTEILGEISSARLIFADLTSRGVLDGRAVRSANVMYELGLAHSVRLPEEIIAVKSDDFALEFDIANVRVNKYLPDVDGDGAIAQLTSAMESALKEIDLSKHLAVKTTVSKLHFLDFVELFQLKFGSDVDVKLPGQSYAIEQGDVIRLASLRRILDLGIASIDSGFEELDQKLLMDMRQSIMSGAPDDLAIQFLRFAKGATKLKLTPFGEAVFENLVENMITKKTTQ
jgi:hypothetical protein